MSLTDKPRVADPCGVRLAGTGIALPQRLMSNDDMSEIVDTNDEWITQRTGIKQRYVSSENETAVGMGTKAVKQALDNAKLKPEDLDLLICATMTPDMICPASACQIIAELGAVPCGGFDLNLACSGFVASLNMAHNAIQTGMYRNIAIVGVEQMSRILNWEDRRTCILFGDGAGAVVLTRSDDLSQGCYFQTIQSDGSRWQELYCPRTDEQVPDQELYTGKPNTLQMNGREVYKFAVTTFQRIIKDAMEACDLSPEDVKMVIPHQSNARIIVSARDKLGFSEDAVYINLDRYGNTSAASVAICLHELMSERRITEGDTVIFVAFGGGLSWASSVWKL